MLYSITKTSISTNKKEVRTSNNLDVTDILFEDLSKDIGPIMHREKGEHPGERWHVSDSHMVEIKIILYE